MRFKKLLSQLGILLVAGFFCTAASYPSKPVTIVTAFGAGGAADLGMRIIAEFATKQGFSMNVTNKVAGGGSQSAQETLKSRADGYTVLYSTPSLQTLAKHKNLGFNILKDFTPVVNITSLPLTFCVLTESNITSFPQFLEEVKKNPSKNKYGTPAPISSQRLFLAKLGNEEFKDIQLKSVPYEGGHAVNTALLGKEINAAFGIPATNKNYISSGDFNLIAVTSAERLEAYPDVPTFAEIYGEEHSWVAYHGLFVKNGTPQEVIDALNEIVKKASEDPEVLAQFKKLDLSFDYLTQEAFAKEVTKMDNDIEVALSLL